MGLCKDCEHFEPDEHQEGWWVKGSGVCGTAFKERDEPEDATCVQIDHWYCKAVGPEFGCIHFDAKEKKFNIPS